MLFVCYLNDSKNTISDTFIKWKKGKVNTRKDIKQLRELLAKDIDEESHNVKIISWRHLKDKKKKKAKPKPTQDNAPAAHR